MVSLREDRRKLRIDALRRRIITDWKNNLDTNYEQLIAWACMNFGTSRRTSKEYIDIIINSSNDFVRMGDIISYEKELPPEVEEVLTNGKK